jgi:AcrR family transcriptional regulator
MRKLKNIILKEGDNLILEEGIKSFTVESLASKLSMSKKTIYQYFPTKEVLLKKIITFKLKSMSKKFDNVFKSEPNDPVVQFIKVRDLHIKFSSKSDSNRLIFLKTRYPDIWGIIEKYISERIETFTNIFLLAQKKGYLKDTIDPTIAAKLFENILSTCARPEFVLKNDFSLKDIIFHLEEILGFGFFKKNALKELQKYKNKKF